MQQTAVDALGDVLLRYVQEMCLLSHKNAELAGRTDTNVYDLVCHGVGGWRVCMVPYTSLAYSHMQVCTGTYHHYMCCTQVAAFDELGIDLSDIQQCLKREVG